MPNALSGSMSLVNTSGYLIIVAIVVFLVLGVCLTFLVRVRYASLSRDLRAHAASGTFRTQLLRHIVADAQAAQSRRGSEVNAQAVVEHRFRLELGGLLMAERFVKASTGLMIILGLVGTFYGLTLSIGKLVTLVSSDASASTELTRSLTQGLTQALSGMSVAFSTSLFGIVAAIIMTTLGVFASVPDRREALMVEIEAYLDNVVLGASAPLQAGVREMAGSSTVPAHGVVAVNAPGLPAAVDGFAQSVAQLQDVVGQFQVSLEVFATSTRDFREFNGHLKDNIQRMSLGFADLSDTLKGQVEALKPSRRG